jgi:hypothetical protein
VHRDVVSVSLDSQEIYTVRNLPETAGGIGLWARTSAATCFHQVQVKVIGTESTAFDSPFLHL